jgi:hypothetical protein
MPPNLNLLEDNMKNLIPFELFGEKQEIGFSIKDIRALERAIGKPVQLIFKNVALGVDFCLAALPILLKQTEDQVVEKIEKYLAEDGTIDKLALPITLALAASGVIGKKAANAAMAVYYPDEAVKEEPLEKNVDETVE